MQAIAFDRYGQPGVLELRDVDKPVVTDDGVLVRVRAAAVNPVDWYTLAGSPYLIRLQEGLRRPKTGRLGVDFAGVVETAGANVQHLQPGDEVFGGRSGAFAEYVNVEKAVARKPANLSFEESAAVPIAGITALQALRDKAGLQPGQKVLVNGASGGVGTFAVQIAKALGAEVTGVCSTRNVELVHSLGADSVVDYTQEDFTRNCQRFEVLLDTAGNRSWSDCKRVLADDATLVAVGGQKGNAWVGPMGHMVGMRLASLGRGPRVALFLATLTREDLDALRELLEAGTVKPVIDRRYELSKVAEAIAYLGEGHARAKVVINVAGGD